MSRCTSYIFDRSVFLFRRDLRLEDNRALHQALSESKEVITIFCIDPRQCQKNELFNDHIAQFMIECLLELHERVSKAKGHLHFFLGEPTGVLSQIQKTSPFQAVYLNEDYTPFSRKRDSQIEEWCLNSSVAFFSSFDALLHPPDEIRNGSGHPYVVFTPFYKNALPREVAEPEGLPRGDFCQGNITGGTLENLERILPKSKWNKTAAYNGGRSEALTILKKISDFDEYMEVRDIPAEDQTTHLAAHNKFGTVSIREVFHAMCDALGRSHGLVRQLYWRDFFYAIAHNFPHVFTHCFRREYDRLSWEDNAEWFERWCNGETGFPIVDAGMRQMNETGYMHNRVRMIVSSFLVKDLHINWRQGERYFAKKLIDYDPAVNNGSWQWAASTGCDAQPYFRIFNPWLQQKKFDVEGEYVKRWIPELEGVDVKEIHRWNEVGPERETKYPAPIVDHSEQKSYALEMFEAVKG